MAFPAADDCSVARELVTNPVLRLLFA